MLIQRNYLNYRLIKFHNKAIIYLEIINKYYLGLNEIMIDRGNNPLPLNVDIFIDNQHFTSVMSDGLIIATPNGSTAYGLSAGGSIIYNEVIIFFFFIRCYVTKLFKIDAIQIIPICPHQFSFRPIILPANIKLRL